jgi:hypothetical protein
MLHYGDFASGILGFGAQELSLEQGLSADQSLTFLLKSVLARQRACART